MSKGRRICAAISLFVLLIIGMVNLMGSPFVHYALKANTESYLQQAGYQRNVIGKVVTKYDRNGEYRYYAQCTLDDSEVVHYFSYGNDHSIQEIQL